MAPWIDEIRGEPRVSLDTAFRWQGFKADWPMRTHSTARLGGLTFCWQPQSLQIAAIEPLIPGALLHKHHYVLPACLGPVDTLTPSSKQYLCLMVSVIVWSRIEITWLPKEIIKEYRRYIRTKKWKILLLKQTSLEKLLTLMKKWPILNPIMF